MSGGQSGIDRAALDSAINRGWPCGGWCPRGRRAEDGPIASSYPLVETPEPDYDVRTRLNVRDSAATLILTSGAPTGGTAFTIRSCQQADRPYLVVDAEIIAAKQAANRLLLFLAGAQFSSLNVAGPRASGWPAGYTYARQLLDAALATWDQADSRSALVSSDSDVKGGPQTEPLQ
ncbi:MAG: putative molybdenum carrier protein [Gammaproteobacteria bacterium]